ncbi:MAG: 50S ribosomal protein L9 [Chloroflexota bacterium]|nr:50S ribosomal protein L9 [Chloroflexota bacterium]
MKVVFLQDVANVANTDDVKEVANGYAKNFLFPRKLAVPATPAELQKVEARNQALARRETRSEQEAEALSQELANTNITIKVRTGAKDRLYGSITNADIAKEIKKLSGHEIDKRHIELQTPIRELGSYQIPIKLTKNVTATISVHIEQEAEPEKEQE